MNRIPVITIDGPTASGKGTVASRVAQVLGFAFLDSGALYRLTALAATELGMDLGDEPGLVRVATGLDVSFEGERILLSGHEVSDAIRAEAVGVAASRIAILSGVRRALVDLQHGFRQAPGLVADGRDMGTVIFPDAELKVFLTASVEARADRRYKQLIGKGFPANMRALLQDLRERDARDTDRAVAPLKPAEGAHLLDTSNMTIEQAVEKVLGWYQSVPQ
ncbi:MAG: (d)CMP kinase [Oxalobacteraceae bacterium]|nr:(d)CMP kinase [Oxalobacteraceae bacterium]